METKVKIVRALVLMVVVILGVITSVCVVAGFEEVFEISTSYDEAWKEIVAVVVLSFFVFMVANEVQTAVTRWMNNKIEEKRMKKEAEGMPHYMTAECWKK